MAKNFRWKRRPTVAIGRPLAQRAATLKVALAALAATHAARAESAMKEGAPWTDRTAYARGSLFARAEGTNIVIGTTNTEYGLFLEFGTSRMAPRPIIRPVMDETARAYMDDAIRLTQAIMFGS